MKKNKLLIIISSIIILLPILVGIILWDRLPEKIATHWGVDGNPDGWSTKFFAVIGLPLFLVVLHIIAIVVTSYDLKNKYQSQKVIDILFWLVPIVSIVCNGFIYCYALGIKLSISFVPPLLIGTFFVVIGNFLPKCRQNSTIGIKVPWALKDEKNWNATHRFAGRVRVTGGIIMLMCAFLPLSVSITAELIIILASVLIPTVYSYIYYKKNK